MEITVEAGDYIQARRVVATDDDRPDQVIPVEFTITGITGGIVEGCVLGPCDPADGWTFEVIRKGMLNLPSTLAEIDAILLTHMSGPTTLTGRGDMWRDDTGRQIDTGLILAWEPREVA